MKKNKYMTKLIVMQSNHKRMQIAKLVNILIKQSIVFPKQ